MPHGCPTKVPPVACSKPPLSSNCMNPPPWATSCPGLCPISAPSKRTYHSHWFFIPGMICPVVGSVWGGTSGLRRKTIVAVCSSPKSSKTVTEVEKLYMVTLTFVGSKGVSRMGEFASRLAVKPIPLPKVPSPVRKGGSTVPNTLSRCGKPTASPDCGSISYTCTYNPRSVVSIPSASKEKFPARVKNVLSNLLDFEHFG